MSERSRIFELVPYFAQAVGHERSEELLHGAARELGLDEAALDDVALGAMLSLLSKRPGIIGVAARFAIQRRVKRAGASGAFPAMTDVAPPPSSGPVVPERDVVQMSELVALLATSVDPMAAQRVVAQHWAASGLRGNTCTRARAFALLESMAEGEGIVAVAARFAKARWHLRRA